MKSKTAIHLQHGQRLVVDEIEIPDPRPDQVIVKLFSSGLCHSQLHQMRDAESPRPIVLGHEGTGVITHVGSDVTHVKEGDHAIVTWVPRTPARSRRPVVPTGATYREELVHGSVYTWGENVLTSGEKASRWPAGVESADFRVLSLTPRRIELYGLADLMVGRPLTVWRAG